MEQWLSIHILVIILFYFHYSSFDSIFLRLCVLSHMLNSHVGLISQNFNYMPTVYVKFLSVLKHTIMAFHIAHIILQYNFLIV